MRYDFILCLSDYHAPFNHIDYLRFSFSLYQKFKTKNSLVIQLGDFFDLCAFSTKYLNDPQGLSPHNELLLAQVEAHAFYDAFPEVRLCIGNHCLRISQKAFTAGLPSACLLTLEDIMEVPKGWQLADHFYFNEILFEHGNGGGNVFTKYMKIPQSYVCGHYHTLAGVQYKNINNRMYFTMACGCGIDASKYAFKYAQSNMLKPILGCGVILDNIPHFVEMRVDKNNRWDGVISL